MQSPEALNAEIDGLLDDARKMLVAGETQDPLRARICANFARAAIRMFEGWHAQKPCPVRYHNLFRRHPEIVSVLTSLNDLAAWNLMHSGAKSVDEDFFCPPVRTAAREEDENDPGNFLYRWNQVPSQWVQASPLVIPLRTEDPSFSHVVAPSISATGVVSPFTPNSSNARPRPEKIEPAPAIEAAALRSEDGSPLASEVLERAIAAMNRVQSNHTAESDVRPYVEFMIFVLGNRPLIAYTKSDFLDLCAAIGTIPTPRAAKRKGLIERYEYALAHAADDLEPISKNTIENRVFAGLRRFYRWCSDNDFWIGDPPKLQRIATAGTAPLARDAFTEAEVRRLFEEPLFVGHGASSRHDAGSYLSQNYFYWAYILAISTGMRAGEIAQIKLSQIVEGSESLEGLYFIDLRPYDASRGRVRMADLPKLKTRNAARIILLQPRLIDLGLGERVEILRQKGHVHLFPDCVPATIKNDIKWGQSITKDWQSRKERITDRVNVSLHSLRHFAADCLDAINLPKRDRDRILGHASADVGHHYGRKSSLNPAIAKRILEADQPVMTWLYAHLHIAREKAVRNGSLQRAWAEIPAPASNARKAAGE